MALSAASLAVTKIGPNGTGKITDLVAALTQAALVGGDAFLCQGKEILVVVGATIVTVKAVADNFGNVLTGNDLTLTIASAKVGIIGPFNPKLYADANGLVQITYSSVTSVFIGLYNVSTIG